MDKIRTSERDFVELSAWQGTYSLIACREWQDGNVYQEWGKKRISKTSYGDKDAPFKVILGDAKTAVAVLQQIIKHIEERG